MLTDQQKHDYDMRLPVIFGSPAAYIGRIAVLCIDKKNYFQVVPSVNDICSFSFMQDFYKYDITQQVEEWIIENELPPWYFWDDEIKILFTLQFS